MNIHELTQFIRQIKLDASFTYAEVRFYEAKLIALRAEVRLRVAAIIRRELPCL